MPFSEGRHTSLSLSAGVIFICQPGKDFFPAIQGLQQSIRVEESMRALRFQYLIRWLRTRVKLTGQAPLGQRDWHQTEITRKLVTNWIKTGTPWTTTLPRENLLKVSLDTRLVDIEEAIETRGCGEQLRLSSTGDCCEIARHVSSPNWKNGSLRVCGPWPDITRPRW